MTSPGLSVVLLIRKWSRRAGNELVATQVASQLSAQGHSVEVYCQKVDESAQGILPESRIHRLGGPSFDPTLAMMSFAWACAGPARRFRNEGRVVLGFNHSLHQDVFRLGGGTHAEFLRRRQSEGLSGDRVLNRAALWMEQRRFSAPGLRRLIAPSIRVHDEVVEHYGLPPDRVAVIYNGVDLNRFSAAAPAEERAAIRAEWGVGLEDRVAIFAGQDLARKGFSVACEAAGRAGCHLVYIGKAKRPSGLPQHVIWAGEQSDVPAHFRSAGALLLPTVYEPFGNVLLEAYACGLPVVSTRFAGATELARGGPLEGLVVDSPRDVEALVNALGVVFDQPDLRMHARDLAEPYTLQRFGCEIEAVLTPPKP